jgi:uncharacterized protein (TIGR02145 family)
MQISTPHRAACLPLLITTLLLITGCQKEREPVVSTIPVFNVTKTLANGGGIILDRGSSEVVSRGVCWSLETEPTLSDFSTVDGRGSGNFSSQIAVLSEDTVYYVRAYATNASGTGYGEAVVLNSFGSLPAAESTPATGVSATTATLHAAINAGNLATDVSFEYGTTTAYGNTLKINRSPVTGIITTRVSLDVTGLTMAEVYHYRVKVENALGITYGSDMKFTTLLADTEGHTYNTVAIGKQVWMQENLRTATYRNGDDILTTSDPGQEITEETAPAYQWPCANVENGRYYTYYTITDSRQVCPDGWHIPSDGEWTGLTDYLSAHGYGYEGNPKDLAKSLAASWSYVPDDQPGNVGNDPGSNNSSGFTGLATGGRYSNGVLSYVGLHGIWWTATESSQEKSLFRCIGYIPAEVFRGVFSKSYGLPVRCLKD